MIFKNHLKTILDLDITQMPRMQQAVMRPMQIFCAVVRDLSAGQMSLHAMSLVYTTLITLVPLLAISFSVLKGFGVHNQIEPFLLSLLQGLGPEKSDEITQQVIGFVDNIKVGVLGAVGLALLIYAVIGLMQKVEAAFNYIWRVGEDRTLAQRFSDYLSVLLMGPLLLFISAGITTTVRHSPIFAKLGGQSWFIILYDLGVVFLPWLVMAAGFTFIYIYMPNTKVRIKSAFIGGLVTALLWKTMGFVFSSFIAGSTNYVAIYAAFATLIVLMIWLYASWLVIMIGSNVSFYMQYPRYTSVSREPLVLAPHLRMTIGLSIITLITKAHYGGEKPLNIDGISQTLNIPILAAQRVGGILEDGGIITMSMHDGHAAYFPALPFDQTPLSKVIDVLEKQGRQGWLQDEKSRFPKEALRAMEAMRASQNEALASQSILKTLGGAA